MGNPVMVPVVDAGCAGGARIGAAAAGSLGEV
jgi:hypothetical protein